MSLQISQVIKLAIGCALLIVAVFGSAKTGWTQVKVVSGEEIRDEFQVATGINISFNGPEYFVNYQLVDQNGFRYDLMGVMNSDVRNEINLTDEQFQQMQEIKDANDQVLNEMVSNAILNDDKSEVEALFREAQDELRSVLEPEQLQRFEQVKNRLAIQQVGLAKHLTSKQFDTPIPADDIVLLDSFSGKVKELRSNRAVELLKASNRKLVDQLNEKQQKILRDTVESEDGATFVEAVLESPMFTKQYSATRKFAVRKTDLFRILKLKKVRTRIELPDDQYAQIKELDRAQTDELKAKLNDPQKQKLNETVAQTDLKRMGTVSAICCGHLQALIGLDESQAQALHQTGRELNAELEKDLREMNQVIINDSMGSLSKSTQELIKSTIGEATSSKKLDPFASK